MVGELMKSDPRQGGELSNLYTVGQNTTRLLLGAGALGASAIIAGRRSETVAPSTPAGG